MRICRIRILFMGILLVVSPPDIPPGPSPALAGTEQATQASNTTEQHQLLAGPKVEPKAIGRDSVGFGARRSPNRQPPVSMQVWQRAMRVVPLTIEQRAEISSIVGEFRQKWGDFNRSHGDEAAAQAIR